MCVKISKLEEFTPKFSLCVIIIIFSLLIVVFHVISFLEKQGKVAEYYEKQEKLLEGFTEMETINETGCLPGNLTEVGKMCCRSVFVSIAGLLVL